MSIVEEFEEIIKEGKIDEFILFLKHLSDEEKKILVPEINQLFVRLNSVEEILSRKFLLQSQYISKEEKERIRKSKVTDTILYPSRLEYQKKLLYLAQFICFREEEDIKWIEKYTINLNDLYKYDVLSWYFPPLLAYDSYYTSRDYRLLLMSMDRYSKVFTIEEIIDSLVSTSFTNTQEIPQITLKEHIWYLFQYECEIHNHYLEGSAYWESKFLELLEENLIDKKRFFYETLLTTTRFTNRAIPNYFFRILDKVELSNKEILANQEELFSVLQNQHSKPITQTLKYIKQIHKEKEFKLTEFSSHIPTLLSWNIKTILNNTLSLIDALIKAYPKERENLALLSLEVLASEDENIQIKLLKILKKHKLLDNQNILDEIKPYADGLYHASKELLPNMEETEIEESFEITPPQYIREENKIPTYESFDDLVFFFSAIFQTKNSIDFDIFIANIIKIDKMITTENIFKLDTLFHQAFEYYYNYGRVLNNSTFYSILSFFLINYSSLLLDRFPNDAMKQKELLDDLDLFIIENKKLDKIYRHNKVYDFKTIKKKPSICYLYTHRCQGLLKHLRGELDLVSLSIPTHKPTYIEHKTLIERMSFSQNNNLDIDTFDFQIALSRCIVDESLINFIQDSLQEELKDIFLYFTNPKELLDLKKVITPEYWIVAVMRKGNSKEVQALIQAYSKEEITYQVTDASNWETTEEPYHYKEWENGERVTKTMMTKKFKLERKRAIQNAQIDSIYRYFNLCNDTYRIDDMEVNYILFLSPLLSHIFLENLLAKVSSTYIDTTIKKALQELLPYLIETWNNSHESNYLFLAYTLTFEEKTTRTLSSELWIKATSEGTMNHQLLGKTLGKLEQNEYAPLKRFTDLIVANMLNISSLHNRGLESLLSSMIKQMNDEPIKGTKKLLEIYLEVLSLTKQKPSTEVLEKLSVWGEVKSLSVVVKKI